MNLDPKRKVIGTLFLVPCMASPWLGLVVDGSAGSQLRHHPVLAKAAAPKDFWCYPHDFNPGTATLEPEEWTEA